MSYGYGEDGGTPVQSWEFQPGWEPPPTPPAAVDPTTGIPYYLQKPEEGPVYGPEYRPDLMSKPLPSWVIPAAVGAGAFVLLGGLGLILGKKRKRRR